MLRSFLEHGSSWRYHIALFLIRHVGAHVGAAAPLPGGTLGPPPGLGSGNTHSKPPEPSGPRKSACRGAYPGGCAEPPEPRGCCSDGRLQRSRWALARLGRACCCAQGYRKRVFRVDGGGCRSCAGPTVPLSGAGELACPPAQSSSSGSPCQRTNRARGQWGGWGASEARARALSQNCDGYGTVSSRAKHLPRRARCPCSSNSSVRHGRPRRADGSAGRWSPVGFACNPPQR